MSMNNQMGRFRCGKHLNCLIWKKRGTGGEKYRPPKQSKNIETMKRRFKL